MLHATGHSSKKRIGLKEAIRFHGHLGPYLILGILAGETALEKLRCDKYFGLQVRVWGADTKPKSCLIDGLQLSTGATYGKGNICKLNGKAIKIEFRNKKTGGKLNINLKEDLKNKLESLDSHADSERFARLIYRSAHMNLFNLSG